MSFPLPPDTRTTGSGFPAQDIDQIVDAEIGMGEKRILAPSGGDDTAKINNTLAGCAPGQLVWLTPGIYKTTAPVTPPPLTGLAGLGGLRATGSQFDWAGFPLTGAILQPTAGFSGTAVIDMVNTTSSEVGGQVFRDLCIDGHLAPQGYGIHASGSIAAVTVEDVMIYHMPSTGLLTEVGSGGGQGPDDWYVSGLKVSRCVIGVQAVTADTWWIGCESSENTSTAWVISGCGNSRFIGCKGENSGGYGWFITSGATAPVHFDNCTSQFNTLSGFKVTGPNAPANAGVVVLASCRSAFDSGLSGLEVNACLSRVIAPGFVTVKTGVHPNYGASLTSSSFGLTLTGAFLQGDSSSTFDDGSNTHALVNNLPVT